MCLILIVGLVLIFPQKVADQPHVAQRRPLPKALKQRLATEAHIDTTTPIQNIHPSLSSRPAQLEKPKDHNDDSVPSDVAGTPRPSKSSSVVEPVSSTESTGVKTEQTQVERSIALSSAKHIRNSPKLQTSSVLVTGLDHYPLSPNDHTETASVPPVSSNNITKLIPYRNINKSVCKYEHELNGLLEQFDRIDSNGDAEVREKRKEVAKVVGEAVERRLWLAASVTGEPTKGFEIDEDIAGEVVPAPTVELADTPVAIDDVVPEQSAPVHSEITVAPPTEESPTEETILQSDASVVSDNTATTPHLEPLPAEPDPGPSASTTPGLGKFSVTNSEPTVLLGPAEASETMGTFLLLEKVAPPVKKHQEIGSDTDEVLALDSDEGESDWSEIED